MGKKQKLNCDINDFCDDANMFHEYHGYSGLVIVDVINLKTKKRGRRMGYIEKRGGPVNYFAACPWCGRSQKKARNRK